MKKKYSATIAATIAANAKDARLATVFAAGLTGADPADVAQKLGVTPERVRQLEAKLRRKAEWSNWRQRPAFAFDTRLSLRTRNCLERAGFRTLAEVQALPAEELRRVRNLGVKGAAEVRRLASAL